MDRIRSVVADHLGKIAYVAAVCGCWVVLGACGQTEVALYALSFIAPYFALFVVALFVDLFF